MVDAVPVQKSSEGTLVDKLRAKAGLVPIIVYLLGFCLAFYMSWRANSNWHRGAAVKLLYGLFSGLQSWGYLPAFAFYKWGDTNPLKFNPLA